MDREKAGEQSERLARGFLDGLLAGDEAAIRATLADDAVLVLPRPSLSGSVIAGASNLVAALMGLRARYVSPTAAYGTVLASASAAAVEWRLTATLASSGADYDRFYSWFFDVSEGRIVEIREYIDTAYGQRKSDEASAAVLARHANEAAH